VAGGSNLYPTGSFKRHDGNDYWMVYAAADIPSGVHHVGRLANLGPITGRWTGAAPTQTSIPGRDMISRSLGD